MARPTKLTKARHDAIVEAIEQGNFAQIAAAANGITEQTYYNWLNRGQVDIEQGTSSLYSRFFEAVKEAEATAEMNTLREMNRDDKWQRRAWWLERRFPRRWGQKQSLEVSGPEGGPVEVDAKAHLEAFLDDRAKAIADAADALAEEGED